MSNHIHSSDTQNDALLERFLDAVVAHAPFDGWSRLAIEKAKEDIGISSEDAGSLPSSSLGALKEWSFLVDRRMLRRIAGEIEMADRVRDKVVLGVRARLEILGPDKEAVRRAAVTLALPQNALVSLRCVHHTVDTIWYAAGDTATDYNYYSKRALLASVYVPTVLYWLSDSSPDKANTWLFLGRRIDDVMKIPGSLSKLRNRFGTLSGPAEFLQKLRRSQRWTYRY
jgi:ubiquinone biosynthesis protein COQ9